MHVTAPVQRELFYQTKENVMLAIAAIILAATPHACCRVVGVNTRSGVALAENIGNRKTFLFTSADKRLIAGLRPGTAVDFSRATGIFIGGHPARTFRAIRTPKGGGGRPVHIEIDCAKFPEFCRGYKPGQNPIDYIGGTTAQDVLDYCWDSPENCVNGPD
jgi:hypothetical protein